MDSLAHLDPTPNTSYEPKFCIDVSSEHTPINLPTKDIGFQQEYDATIAASEDHHLPRHSRASSSSQHTAASTVPTLLKLGSLGTGLKKLSADYDSVASRTSIKETCVDMDNETVVSSIFESVVKRDRDQHVVQTLKDSQNLHNILERKAELGVRGEKLAEQRLYEAEADVEVKHWEQRNSDIALYEISQEFESQRLQLQQANQWADQAQRDKISLYGELEIRSGLFRENQAKDCQEIEQMRRICCEETDRARQVDELSVHQERNPMSVSQLLTQFQDLQNKVSSLSDTKEFLRSWDSEQRWRVPRS